MPQFLFPIVVLILGIWMPTAFAQVEFQGTKLHQVQIAEPDTSGSVLVRSIDGRFSVRLPSKPDSAAIYETGPTEPVLRTFTVHTALPEGVNLSASRVVYRAGTNSAGFYFGRLWAQDFRAWKQNYFARAWKLDPPATATQFVRRSINGNPAVDFLMKSPTHSSYVRAVLNAPDVVILTVDFSPSEGKTSEQLAKPFFDSLILSAKR